ncbi:hypothetical protein IX332_000389 [Porphyromonas levii]|nr:hypothetical protein [Porphyromonas levii]MBR8759650.1 hypothetical protein [Porphyromonas levii]MBR8763543.1 hypothetical protein [Porphyromonas levii]MBR8774070.1 hypothetical protein [Porphyromonas levii]
MILRKNKTVLVLSIILIALAIVLDIWAEGSNRKEIIGYLLIMLLPLIIIIIRRN